MANRKKAVFLDRDGTIIVDAGYAHRESDLEFLPGSFEGLRHLQSLGFELVIVTNQSGIARGYFTEDDYRLFTSAMLEQLSDHGVSVSAVYHCPHLNGCTCRKPALGMYIQARDDLELDFEQSYAVGDRMRDLSLCESYPTTGILLSKTGIGANAHVNVHGNYKGAIYAASSLYAAARLIETLEDNASHHD